MDLNYVLMWLVGISTGTWMVRWYQIHRWRYPGWHVVGLFVLGVLGVGVLVDSAHAGYWSGGAWAALLMAPLLAQRLAYRLVARQRYRAAARVAWLTGLLHPLDGWPRQSRVVGALEALQRGHPSGERVLEALAEAGGPMARQARLHLLRVRHDWDGVIELAERLGAPRRVDPSTRSIYLRALGERGRVADMLDAYQAGQGGSDRPLGPPLTELFVCGLAGRIETVDRLLAGPLKMYGPLIRGYWQATAHQVAGSPKRATELLAPLLEGSDRLLEESARQRLAHPLDPLDGALTERHQAILDGIESALAETDRVGTLARPVGQARLTYALLVLEILVFLAELPGGATSAENLIRLGALVGPLELLGGEYWRVVTAGFLHYGSLHLVLNLFGIWYFGRFVEGTLGALRFLVLYLLPGLGSLALILVLTSLVASPPFVLVGASASLMGLVGASGAVLWKRWRRRRSRAIRRQLLFLVAIVGLQTLFDLVTPAVSFAAHFGGVVLGLGLGLVLARPDELEPKRRPGKDSRPGRVVG